MGGSTRRKLSSISRVCILTRGGNKKASSIPSSLAISWLRHQGVGPLLPNILHTLYSCDVSYHQRIVVVVRRGKSLVIHQSRGFGGSLSKRRVWSALAITFLALCQCWSPIYVMLRTASLQKHKPHRRRCQSIGTYPGMCPRFSTPTYLVSVLGLSQTTPSL